jgi:SulP family sulfate permease
MADPLPWNELGQVKWAAIASQLPNVGTLILLSTVGILLNASGLEIVARKDIDINRELRGGGVANLVVGSVGGLVGYHWLSLSSLRIRLGPGGRLAGIVVAIICLFVLVAGAGFLSLFPKMIGGGLLLYLGLTFLKEWVYDTWFRLPLIEYSVIFFILVVIIGVGFLEGIAVGVVAAIVLFVVAYSRVNVVRNVLSGRHVSSRASRDIQAQQYLYEQGESLYILRLQGFIFFGTADRLLNQVRDRLENPDLPDVRVVLLDLRRVTGLDSTALTSLSKMRLLVLERTATLLMVEASDAVRQQLQRGGLPAGEYVRYHDTLDRGIEWVENTQLARANWPDRGSVQSIVDQLGSRLPDTAGLDILASLLERLEMEQGEYLMKQGDAATDLFFIESGQVTAQLEYNDRPPVRLQTMGGGHVLGELGFYLDQPRTASVIMDEPGVVYRLTRKRLGQMENQEPEIASLVHRLIVHLLAERVTHLVNTVNALEQ